LKMIFRRTKQSQSGGERKEAEGSCGGKTKRRVIVVGRAESLTGGWEERIRIRSYPRKISMKSSKREKAEKSKGII